MFKRIIIAIAAMVCIATSPHASATDLTYNSIATAYVTTTISQYVVFDSTMQAGGTFTFSVLAHNGGGRVNQSDTANVKMQFYDASNTLISTVNTNYSANLPQPTQSGNVNSQGVTLSGNPQADPAVPWTTLSITSVNCGGSCANIAYVKVSMYGVDGSFWAGDYGPWYRIPTLTLNGGPNLIYNPEFGPYNGTTAQGWTTSPAFGACQGAWGGSNACIVDASGTPGQSTAGLVANVNGGGPDANGGTKNGTAGGYNSTISAAVVVASGGNGNGQAGGGGGGNNGPVAINNPSGTTDSNPSGTTTLGVTNAGTYTNSGTNGDVTNTGTFTNASGGTTGDVTNSGTFTNNGTTGIVNNQSNGNFTNNGTTGNVTNAGTFDNNGTTGTVNNSGTFNNNSGGTTGAFTNSGTLTNAGTIASLTNTGTATNSGTITGTTTITSGTLTNSGTTGDWTNNGTVNNSGTMGNGTNNSSYTNGGTTGNVTNTGTFTNNSGATTGTVNNTGGFTNNGTTGDVTYNNFVIDNSGIMGNVIYNVGSITNESGATIGNVTNNDTFNNSGTAGNVTNNGNLTNSGTTGDVTNNSTASNSGTMGVITNANGTFTNSGITGDWNNGAILNNSGTMGNGTNSGAFTMTGGSVGTINNSGTVAISGGNSGAITNSGAVYYTGGNVDSISNNGTYNVSGGGNTIALNSYTQGSSGTTIMNIAPTGSQTFNINGPATLDGTLVLNEASGPYSYGHIPLITAASLSGQYATVVLNPDNITPLGYELSYSSTGLNLNITPSAAATQQGINSIANDSKTINNIVAGQVGGAVGGDCDAGPTGSCASISYGYNNIGTGNLQSGGITVGSRLNDKVRVGVFVDQSFNNPAVGGVSYKSTTPVVGATLGYNVGNGLDVTASIASGSGQYTITRPTIDGAESGVGKPLVDSNAAQVKVAYTMPIMADMNFTPYIGLRYTQLNVAGYTESGAVYPLTVNPYSQSSTDVIAGATVTKKLTDKLTASVSVGLTQNVAQSAGSITGTSDIVGSKTFNSPLASGNSTSLGVGAGLSYEVVPSQHINLNVGFKQKSVTNPDVGSVGLSYSWSF